MDTITPKQLAWLETLRQERGLGTSDLAAMTKRQASQEIDRLKALPKAQAPAPVAPASDETDIPAGRYAVILDDEVVFVVIDRPQRGRYAGRVFVATLHGENKRNAYGADRAKLIAAIEAEGFEAAVRRYAHHRNECGFCRHGLTDAFSRFFGVGPACARRHGLPFSFASYLKRFPDQAPVVAAWQAEDARARDTGVEDERLRMKADFARHEREQENAAYEAKMRRDEQLFGGDFFQAGRDIVANLFTPETPAHLA